MGLSAALGPAVTGRGRIPYHTGLDRVTTMPNSGLVSASGAKRTFGPAPRARMASIYSRQHRRPLHEGESDMPRLFAMPEFSKA